MKKLMRLLWELLCLPMSHKRKIMNICTSRFDIIWIANLTYAKHPKFKLKIYQPAMKHRILGEMRTQTKREAAVASLQPLLKEGPYRRDYGVPSTGLR